MTINEILATIGGAATIFGIFFGIFQFVKAQKWKKAEFASKEIQKLSDDKILQLACVFLDWDGRDVSVPKDYIESTLDCTLTHSWETLKDAMSPGIIPNDGRKGFSDVEVFYRDVFDHFFTYLERLNHYVNINLIDLNDIKPVHYWLTQVFYSQLGPDPKIFNDYLHTFKYEGVFELARRFKI